MFEKKVLELEEALAESKKPKAATVDHPMKGDVDHLELTGIKLDWIKEKRAPIAFSRTIEAMATTETIDIHNTREHDLRAQHNDGGVVKVLRRSCR